MKNEKCKIFSRRIFLKQAGTGLFLFVTPPVLRKVLYRKYIFSKSITIPQKNSFISDLYSKHELAG